MNLLSPNLRIRTCIFDKTSLLPVSDNFKCYSKHEISVGTHNLRDIIKMSVYWDRHIIFPYLPSQCSRCA